MNASIRHTLSIGSLLAAAMLASSACSSPPGDPAPDPATDPAAEETTGEAAQGICFQCDIVRPPRRIVLPDPPTAGPTFDCVEPQYRMINGQCWKMGRIPGPGGLYPISLFLCPAATPVLRCAPFGRPCTCWSY